MACPTNVRAFSSSVRLLLFFALPVLLGARECGGSVPIGGECDERACGPAPGAPAVLCPDGTIGGNTGRCVARADGTCGWEFRDCPPPEACVESECGPAPFTPLPTRCERGEDGSCHWVIDDPSECSTEECGPAPGTASWICADGTVGGFTGRCVRDPTTGSCHWESIDCPRSGECDVGECGPAPAGPVCTCADGSLGCNTGRCVRGADGSCAWEWRTCPPERVCGGEVPDPAEATCEPGYFCAYRREAMCGAADHPGVCTRIPDESECAAIDGGGRDLTVCGCDGVTYPSECDAWAAGVSVLHDGPCGADCDVRDVACDALPPRCPAGQVPSQRGLCWGPCVPVSSCEEIRCMIDRDCPDPRVWFCDPSRAVCRLR
jgi:hypothetical protein